MKKQEMDFGDPEPDPTARRGSFLNRVRGRLLGLPLPHPFEAPNKAESGLDRLEGRFAIVAASLEESDEATLTAALEPAVDSLVHNGLLNDHTAAEARLFMPEDKVRPGMAPKAARILDIFKNLAATKGDVSVYRIDAPLTLTKHADSPVDSKKVWSEVGMEYDYFDHQIHGASLSHSVDTVVVGLTAPGHARQLFGDRLVFGIEPLEEHQPVVLTRLGTEAHDLVLAPPFPRQFATGRA